MTEYILSPAVPGYEALCVNNPALQVRVLRVDPAIDYCHCDPTAAPTILECNVGADGRLGKFQGRRYFPVR
jgi:hypothetical protein